MELTRTTEELTEIADYIFSVMTEREKADYFKMTTQERDLLIDSYLAKRG
ncbi:hypothetical protein MKL29_03480 [Streptococcus suis]|nr:hypothetical protein [Streptococcus suis]